MCSAGQRRFAALASQQVAVKLNDMTEAKRGTDLDRWIEDLVCPVCFGTLQFSDVVVECSACARSYPVVDGIPVLIAERATPTRSSLRHSSDKDLSLGTPERCDERGTARDRDPA